MLYAIDAQAAQPVCRKIILWRQMCCEWNRMSKGVSRKSSLSLKIIYM